jgi:crotonobetainyl-CoA hydratase
MTCDEVAVTQKGAVTTIRLNRPDQLNAITPEMHHALQTALDNFAADNDQQICVFTGTGRAFCAGSDLKRARETRAAGKTLERPRSGYAGLIQRYDLDKPLIAAVNGLAVGAVSKSPCVAI